LGGGVGNGLPDADIEGQGDGLALAWELVDADDPQAANRANAGRISSRGFLITRISGEAGVSGS